MLFVAIILSYLLGSVPSSYITGKLWKGIDLRKHGSGNVGSANTFRVLGPLPGLGVFLADAAKGLIAAVFISRLAADGPLSYEWTRVLCGVAAVCGHNWTIFLNFKGGKGVATSIGAFFGLVWQAIGIALALGLVIIALSRYVSLGSILGGITLVVLTYYCFETPRPYFFLASLVTLLVIIKHIPNIRRLLTGKENKISFKRNKEK
jgi:glycerol-3-phosphate acyltransferase PlsY